MSIRDDSTILGTDCDMLPENISLPENTSKCWKLNESIYYYLCFIVCYIVYVIEKNHEELLPSVKTLNSIMLMFA